MPVFSGLNDPALSCHVRAWMEFGFYFYVFVRTIIIIIVKLFVFQFLFRLFPFSSGPQLSLHLHGCFLPYSPHCCRTKSALPNGRHGGRRHLELTAEGGDIWQRVSVVNRQRPFRPFPFDPSTSVTYAKYREEEKQTYFPAHRWAPGRPYQGSAKANASGLSC